jgi:hypothetical protein
MRWLLLSGYDRDGWYFLGNDFLLCYLRQQQHVDTKRAARGGGHGIDLKNVKIGKLMYVKTQGNVQL